MKVELSKSYRTADGYKVRLIERIKCIDYPFLGVVIRKDDTEYPLAWNEEGYSVSSYESNLVEVSKYEGFKVDDKVIVWNDPLVKRKAYFAEVSKDGEAMTFGNGTTSFSGTGVKTSWENCVLYDGFYRGKR
jgi:hypothetical protein